ncbi:MAG TPA: hypothetical protein VHO50_10410 [Bacteroidales bacterium]|nr:hypothetical protein [Bacteroidales bacterium]
MIRFFPKSPFCLVIFCFLTSCSVTSYQKAGSVSPGTFHYKTTFTEFKSCIVIPLIIGNDTSNFLFDTGCQITLLQNDTVTGGKLKITGASDNTAKLSHARIDTLIIGDILINNTHAASGNFEGIKEQIPTFGGLIGQPIINKANWLIDYPNKTIEISSQDLSDETFKTIRISEKGGSPFTFITIDGKKYKALIDLGSSKGMSIPQNQEPANAIIQKYDLHENEREVFRIGGLEKVKEHIGIIPVIEIGDIVFNDVETAVFNTNKIRIGNLFFKDCQLYIDNTNKCYKVKRAR